MHRDRKPWWQQATALVTVGTGGAITGFTFVPGPAASVTSPSSVPPLHLLALEQAARASDSGRAPNARAVGGDSQTSATADALLRSAIVNVAKYYLSLAQTRTPAQMEALIWDNTSLDGADHGPSCAAFASLALELAAQAVGQRSWVTGGTTYPWPLPGWADVRVDENPASPGITSIVQDAERHGRWHPLGDGYAPQPGDWVLFDEHVEVVISDTDGVLDTIGANSEPNLTVNAHSFTGSLASDGVQGFVDNGHLAPSATTGTGSAGTPPTATATGTDSGSAGSGAAGSGAAGSPRSGKPVPARQARPPATPAGTAATGLAHIPGVVQPAGPGVSAKRASAPAAAPSASAARLATTPGAPATPAARPTAAPAPARPTAAPAARPTAAPAPARPDPAPSTAAGTGTGAALIPGLAPAAALPRSVAPANAAATGSAAPRAGQPTGGAPASQRNVKPAVDPSAAPASPAVAASSAAPYRRHSTSAATTPGTSAQQAFINLVAPGAIAGQQRFGIPAAVTIAQAIDESDWGQSELAARYHNLFGIKGNGPAGSVTLPTSEYEGGQWVTVNAQFRVYNNAAQSITDHDELLATSGYYLRAMADREFPDAFANDLSGVYATDPGYGANLIALMKLYNLYRFDVPAGAPSATAAPQPSAAVHPATHSNLKAAGAGTAAIPGLTAPALQFPAGAATPAASSSPSVPAASPTPGAASIPGLAAPGHVTSTAAAASQPSAQAPTPAGLPGAAFVPGMAAATVTGPASMVPMAAVPTAAVPTAAATALATAAATAAGSASTVSRITGPAAGRPKRAPAVTTPAWYQPEMPSAVTTAYFASAKGALGHAESLYRDIAARTRIPWQLLAACDWMQCKAHPRYSPVQGEKLGTVNSDGTSFRTRSQALTQCAADLVTAAAAIYLIDLTSARPLSVRSLAEAFAAFRWGSLLQRHGVSAMEFPYSVAGLTARHTKMHWPDIDAPDAPDRPGARFREPFGAVPVVLSLGYPATV